MVVLASMAITDGKKLHELAWGLANSQQAHLCGLLDPVGFAIAKYVRPPEKII